MNRVGPRGHEVGEQPRCGASFVCRLSIVRSRVASGADGIDGGTRSSCGVDAGTVLRRCAQRVGLAPRADARVAALSSVDACGVACCTRPLRLDGSLCQSDKGLEGGPTHVPESFRDFFSSEFFMPHGHCYLWNPGLVWLEVVSNALIAVSYVAISTALAYLAYRLKELPFRLMYLAFGAFIVSCGITHVFDIIVIWRPMYWLDGFVRAVTAVASVGTAIALRPLIPKAIELARGAKVAEDRGVALESVVTDLGTMYERARDLEQLKTRFFASMSHELRTPLALILGPTAKLLEGTDLSEQHRRELGVIDRNARALLKHVNDLLDLSKLEAGKMKASYAEVDLARVVRLTASYFESLAAERSIAYVIEAPRSLMVEVDPDKIQRVIVNVLSNAFKFVPNGGKVRCSLTTDGASGGAEPGRGRAIITICDSGPGIKPEHRQVIFDRFRQIEGVMPDGQEGQGWVSR